LFKYALFILDPSKGLNQRADPQRRYASPRLSFARGYHLPKYVFAAFGSLDLPWKPGYLRLALRPIYRHMFKPLKQIDDIFLAQILGHKRDRTRPFP
jgi:hypothetical protein